MKMITKIEPVASDIAPRRKQVAAYCRVSTDLNGQLSSLETQKAHYEEYIKSRADWEFAGIYYDEGVTGTKKDKRPALMQMMRDCEDGYIDHIITKSISRFSRNTADSIELVRKLTELNVTIYFEKENLDSGTMESELLLSILAALAENESASTSQNARWAIRTRYAEESLSLHFLLMAISQNVKLGLQFRYQSGKVLVNHNRFLGYTKDKDGNLIIDPEQAEVVLRIYREFLEGASMLEIGRGLERDGIKTAAGCSHWAQSTVKTILSNEKYMGDALLQKTYTVDFLTKKRVKNNGDIPQYYVENSHPAIVSRDKFLMVQAEIHRRSHLTSEDGKRKKTYSGKYALSNIVHCCHCGENFRRLQWTNGGNKVIVWRCLSRLDKNAPDCTARTVNEEVLHRVIVRAINRLIRQRADFMPMLETSISSIVLGDTDAKIAEIDSKLSGLQRELVQAVNADEAYEAKVAEIEILRESREKLLIDEANKAAAKKRMEEISEFIKSQPSRVMEYDESLVRRLVERVTVHDEHITVKFKTGTEIEIRE